MSLVNFLMRSHVFAITYFVHHSHRRNGIKAITLLIVVAIIGHCERHSHCNASSHFSALSSPTPSLAIAAATPFYCWPCSVVHHSVLSNALRCVPLHGVNHSLLSFRQHICSPLLSILLIDMLGSEVDYFPKFWSKHQNTKPPRTDDLII